MLTLTFLRGKCDENLYRLNLALILIGQFMWVEQIKRYNGNNEYGKFKYERQRVLKCHTSPVKSLF
jgi:hypothetical protein